MLYFGPEVEVDPNFDDGITLTDTTFDSVKGITFDSGDFTLHGSSILGSISLLSSINQTTPSGAPNANYVCLDGLAEGSGSGTVTEGLRAVRGYVQDRTTVKTVNVTDATNATPIVITVDAPITLTHVDGTAQDRVTIDGVLGNTAANGLWNVTVIDSTHFSLNGSVGNGAYASGGIATNRGLMYAGFFGVLPRAARGGLVSNPNGDDIGGVIIQNNGNFNGTDGLYFGVGPASAEWLQCITIDASAVHSIIAATGNGENGLSFSGTLTGIGLQLHTADIAGFGISLPNDVGIGARNGADSAFITLMMLTSADRLSFKGDAASLTSSNDLIVNTTAASLLGGGKGIQIRSTDGTTVELNASADTAASSTAAVYARGRSSSNDVVARMQANSGGVIRIGGLSGGHNVELQRGGVALLTMGSSLLTLADGVNMAFNSTTGTKLGTATSDKFAFHNATPIAQQTVSGSRGGNAALADLLTKLAAKGLIVDGTSA